MSKFGDQGVLSTYGLKKVQGDFGIEIEAEGQRPFPSVTGWRSETDGSLKGDYTIEYVTRGAVPHKYVKTAITELLAKLAKVDANINHSVRAGVHVHMNMQDYTIADTVRTALLYYTFETALTRFCGPNRVGNHFCFRASDAEYGLHVLTKTIMSKNLGHLGTEHIRYSALNFNSLSKYGTLEFRAMETEPTLGKISVWCDTLHKIREYASTKLKNNEELSTLISMMGPENFFIEVVGEELAQHYMYPLMDRDIMEDFRLIQPLIYLEI